MVVWHFLMIGTYNNIIIILSGNLIIFGKCVGSKDMEIKQDSSF